MGAKRARAREMDMELVARVVAEERQPTVAVLQEPPGDSALVGEVLLMAEPEEKKPEIPEGVGEAAGRSGPPEKDDRQKMVIQLRQMGYSHPQIAGLVGVSEKTVWRDLKEIRTRVRGELSPSRVSDIVIDGYMKYTTLYEKAMIDYTGAQVGSLTRSRNLEVALKANMLGLRLLQDVHILPKAPIRLEAHLTEHPALRRLNPDERTRVAAGLQRFFEMLGSSDQMQKMLQAMDGDGFEETLDIGGDGDVVDARPD